MNPAPDFRPRIDAVRAKLPIADVIGQQVKLSGSAGAKARRGQCPFHGSKSASFAVMPSTGFAQCFGCQWRGDVVSFTRDFFGLSFIDALKQCEAQAGIGGAERAFSPAPVARERNPVERRHRVLELVEPLDMARALWRRARPDRAAVRRYFLGRGVLDTALSDVRLAEFRYLGECPCTLWEAGERWAKAGAPIAPAVMAMVREPVMIEGAAGPVLEFVPVGLHVTWLNPAGDGTMVRRKPWAKPGDPEPLLPKRKMFGPVGRGCVLLGAYSPAAHLFVGEGNETVLSAISLAGAGEAVIGVATLSLDNLQGRPLRWRSGVLPLHRIEPDPERGPFTIPGHRGPVTGLVDSDMSPLRGPKDRETGAHLGEPLIERKGGPVVRRAITGPERARICAELLVKGWRGVTPGPVEALRAPAGMDFNDAALAEAGRVAA